VSGEDFPEADAPKAKNRMVTVQVLRDWWEKNPDPKEKMPDGEFRDAYIRHRAGTRQELELTDEVLDKIEAGAYRRVKDDELDDEPLGVLDKSGHFHELDEKELKKRKAPQKARKVI